jgi:hypothetical protein
MENTMRSTKVACHVPVTILLVLLGGLCTVPQAAGQIFGPGTTYGSGGSGILSVAIADVNGDGKPDVLVVNECGTSNLSCGIGSAVNGSVAVLLGNGDGTFQSAVNYNSGGFIGYSLAVADINGDGKPDVVVVNACGNSTNCQGTVGVLLGNGDGTFEPAQTYSSGGSIAGSVAIADVNLDGKPDILVTNQCISTADCIYGVSPGTVGVLLGNGDGTFQPALTYSNRAYGPESLAVGDMNGDGRPDLLAANYLGSVSVLLGNGDGTFQSATTYETGGSNSFSLALSDVNKDGKLDVVVSDECGKGCTSNQGFVSLLLGNGDGTLQPALILNSGGDDALAVAIADVNGDGNPDILVGNEAGLPFGPSALAVLLGNGNGTFQPAVDYGGDISNIFGLAVGDLTANGKPDVVAACYAIGVLLNISPYYRVTLSGSPKQPLTKNSDGDLVAQVVVTNTGNVTLTTVQVTIAGTSLGSAAPVSVPAPIANLAPGSSATVTLTFPPSAASAGVATAPLKVGGTYANPAYSISGNWALSFRSVAL